MTQDVPAGRPRPVERQRLVLGSAVGLVVAVALVLDRHQAHLARTGAWLPGVGLAGFVASTLLLGTGQGLVRVGREDRSGSRPPFPAPGRGPWPAGRAGGVAAAAPARGHLPSSWPLLALAALGVGAALVDVSWETWPYVGLGVTCLAVAVHQWQVGSGSRAPRRSLQPSDRAP